MERRMLLEIKVRAEHAALPGYYSCGFTVSA
jgi:hypothetical protein